ncbi:MAG: rfaE bifunctional protein kinase chain/domain [Flavobacteriales bacterium]
MNKEEILGLFEQFNQQRVLVIGDVMIDSYYWGKVERISPEAPVPVVSVHNKENRLGGAANVALNLKALGATPIMASVVGADHYGQLFQSLLTDLDLSNIGISPSMERPTTVKTRIISSGQQMIRVDEETTKYLSDQEETDLLKRINHILDHDKIDVIIFEDYNKGVLTKNLIKTIVDKANSMGIPTTVDPKNKHFFTYKNVTLFKPNLKELKEGLKKDFDKSDTQALENSVAELHQRLNHKISLITLSELGVYVNDGNSSHIPAHIRNISDVSGAGDSVISVASLCLACQTPTVFMAALSNLAGGLVCEKIGVVPIDKNLLLTEALKLSETYVS